MIYDEKDFEIPFVKDLIFYILKNGKILNIKMMIFGSDILDSEKKYIKLIITKNY